MSRFARAVVAAILFLLPAVLQASELKTQAHFLTKVEKFSQWETERNIHDIGEKISFRAG